MYKSDLEYLRSLCNELIDPLNKITYTSLYGYNQNYNKYVDLLKNEYPNLTFKITDLSFSIENTYKICI